MVEDLSSLLRDVSVLREVDSVVDFARGWLQLRILLVLGYFGQCSVDRVVGVLGERRKAVLDALRKMRVKGLIDVDDSLTLTDYGVKLYNMLVGVISSELLRSELSDLSSTKALIQDLHRDITKFFYLYDTIVALGTSKGFELSLSTLASITRLSPDTLEDYLRPYVEGDVKLFKRVVKTGKFLVIPKKKIIYRLTDEGLKIYRRLPDYVKYKGSTRAMILRVLTRSGHPRIILKRLAMILAVGSAIISLLAAFTTSPLSLIIVLTWVLLMSFLALIIEITY